MRPRFLSRILAPRELPPAPVAAPAAPPRPQPSPPPESAMETVARYAEQLGKELHDAENREHRDHAASLLEANARVQAAVLWVDRIGLNHAVPAIIDAVCHWPAWSKREDFRQWAPDDVYDITADESQELGPRAPRPVWRIGFRLSPEGARYGFAFARRGSFDGTDFGEARVYDGDTLVFSLDCSRSYDSNRDDPRWETAQPSVLVPGEWVLAVLTLDHRLRLHSQRSIEAARGEALRARAAGLPDPRTLR